MNTAIPVQRNQLAGHFAKASAWHIFDHQQQRIATFTLAAGCQGKRQLMDKFLELDVGTVKVRHIGQCMLAKLLAHGFVIEQLNQTVLPSVAASTAGELLTNANQGRVSKRRCQQSCSGNCQHD